MKTHAILTLSMLLLTTTIAPAVEAELRDQLAADRALVEAEFPSEGVNSVLGHALARLVLYPEPESRDLAWSLLRRPDRRSFNMTARSSHYTALAILVSLRDPEVRRHLEARATTGDSSRRREAMQLLATLGDPASLPLLDSMAADTTLGELQADARRAARNVRLAARGIVVPFDLSDEHIGRLLEHGLTVYPETGNDLYELLPDAYPLVTSDVVWRTFMMLTRGSWDELELLVLAPRTVAWCHDLATALAVRASDESDPQLRRDLWTCAARVLVAIRLVGQDVPAATDLPADLAAMVTAEVARIDAAASIESSPLLGIVEDYVAYAPTSDKAMEPALAAWHRVITWLGRGTWRFMDPDQTRQALLLVETLQHHPDLLRRWAELDTLLTRWVGSADDITPGQLIDAMPDLAAALADPEAFDRARERLASLPLPRVNSFALAWHAAEAQGLRLLGQRGTPAAEAIQSVLDEGVWPPSVVTVLQQTLDDVDDTDVTQAPLPTAGLACLATLRRPEAGIPSFMATEAWAHKQQNTALAGWAEIEHAMQPFIKHAVHYLGASCLTDAVHGYVEPVPAFYQALRALAGSLRDELEASGFFVAQERPLSSPPSTPWYQRPFPSEGHEAAPSHVDRHGDTNRVRPDRARWDDLLVLLDQLLDLSQRELAGEPQTVADALLLRGMGKRLQGLGLHEANLTVAPQPMGFTACVASELNVVHERLHLSVGRPLALLVAVPGADGRRYVCKGPVYGFHAFTLPADSTLTDESWRAQDVFPAPGGRVPWILGHPDLDHRFDVSSAELEQLAVPRLRDLGVTMNEHHLVRWYRKHPEFAGRLVPAHLADRLVEVASLPDIAPSVRMFLLQEATRLTGTAVTATHWHALLDACMAASERSAEDLVLYWGLQAEAMLDEPTLHQRIDDLVTRCRGRGQQIRDLARNAGGR